jgi:cytochrome c-type biogenesis protein CcmH/NrfG
MKDLSALNMLHDGGWNKAQSSRDIVRNVVASQELERDSQLVKDSEIQTEIKRLNAVVAEHPENPDNVKQLRRIGELEIRQKNPKGAQDAYQRALKLTPADGSLAIKIGDINLMLIDEKIKEAHQKTVNDPANTAHKEALTKI